MVGEKTYDFDVEVFSLTVSEWFRNRERRKCAFSNISAQWRLEKLNDFYEGIYHDTNHFFSMPSRRIIMLGLKIAGIMNFPGVRGYYVKSWRKHSCVITVKLDENKFDDREYKIKERIQRFFSSAAIVKQPGPDIPNW